MSAPLLILRSSIKPSLIRNAVIRGTSLAGIGATLLLLSGTVLPSHLLKSWGLPLFLLGMTLITLGLWPYRRLKSLENNPNRILIDQKEWLHFSEKGKPLLSFPLQSINAINYLETNKAYGIDILLKESLDKSQKVLVHQPTTNQYITRKPSFKEEGANHLFLPYFSKNAFKEFEALLRTGPDYNPD